MQEMSHEELKKKVDEPWKDTVKKEGPEPQGPSALPEVTFDLFATSLMMESLVALGEIEHPVTKKKELNAPHAKFVIDTLAMLQEKTRNNLTKDESEMLEAMLYDLRMRFVAKQRK